VAFILIKAAFDQSLSSKRSKDGIGQLIINHIFSALSAVNAATMDKYFERMNMCVLLVKTASSTVLFSKAIKVNYAKVA
jgi:hypothetical protein